MITFLLLFGTELPSPLNTPKATEHLARKPLEERIFCATEILTGQTAPEPQKNKESFWDFLSCCKKDMTKPRPPQTQEPIESVSDEGTPPQIERISCEPISPQQQPTHSNNMTKPHHLQTQEQKRSTTEKQQKTTQRNGALARRQQTAAATRLVRGF